jgi:hypothetical protein
LLQFIPESVRPPHSLFFGFGFEQPSLSSQQFVANHKCPSNFAIEEMLCRFFVPLNKAITTLSNKPAAGTITAASYAHPEVAA